MSARTQGRKPVYGVLHESGLNRQQRREAAITERDKPKLERQARWEDHVDLQKEQLQESIKRQQMAAHDRAEVRRGNRGTIVQRMSRYAAEYAKRREERKARRATHARKMAV